MSKWFVSEWPARIGATSRFAKANEPRERKEQEGLVIREDSDRGAFEPGPIVLEPS